MTVFVLASLAIVLVLVALALRPLWTGARRSALALALALGVGTAGLYALLGTPDALDPAQVKAPETLEEAIVQLERRLADEPGSVEGWVLLGRSHAAQGNWTAAADAFGKAQALLPEEPDLMVELADARMRAAPDGRFPADAVALLERAVTLRPDHQRALFYLGAQQLQAGQPAEAAATWGRLLPLVDATLARAARSLASKIGAVAPAPVDPDREDIFAFTGTTTTRAEPHLPILRAAIAEHERLSIAYLDLNELESHRDIRPLALDLQGQIWVLAAWCETKAEFATFGLDRLLDIVPRGESFPREAGKRLTDYRKWQALGLGLAEELDV